MTSLAAWIPASQALRCKAEELASQYGMLATDRAEMALFNALAGGTLSARAKDVQGRLSTPQGYSDLYWHGIDLAKPLARYPIPSTFWADLRSALVGGDTLLDWSASAFSFSTRISDYASKAGTVAGVEIEFTHISKSSSKDLDSKGPLTFESLCQWISQRPDLTDQKTGWKTFKQTEFHKNRYKLFMEAWRHARERGRGRPVKT